MFASSCAIARAFPIFSRRSSSSRRAEKKNVTVEFLIVGQDGSPLGVAELDVHHISSLEFLFCIFENLLNASQMKAFLLFSVSPTLLTESAWQLASWTHHVMR